VYRKIFNKPNCTIPRYIYTVLYVVARRYPTCIHVKWSLWRWPAMVNKQYTATEVPESTIQIKNWIPNAFFLFHTADTAITTRVAGRLNKTMMIFFFHFSLVDCWAVQVYNVKPSIKKKKNCLIKNCIVYLVAAIPCCGVYLSNYNIIRCRDFSVGSEPQPRGTNGVFLW